MVQNRNYCVLRRNSDRDHSYPGLRLEDSDSCCCCCCSVAQLCLTLRPCGLKHTRLPSPSPGVCSNSCPLSQWCHPIILSSVTPFSSCLQSFLSSGSLPMIQLFASGGQSIEASASVLPMNIQGWFPLGLTGLISLQSQGLSRGFSSTTMRVHQMLGQNLKKGSNAWWVVT